MWRELEWTWYEKIGLHFGAVFGLLMLPISGPIVFGMIIGMYIRGERYTARKCTQFAFGLIRFMFDHDIDRLMDVYEKVGYEL